MAYVVPAHDHGLCIRNLKSFRKNPHQICTCCQEERAVHCPNGHHGFVQPLCDECYAMIYGEHNCKLLGCGNNCTGDAHI